MTLQTSVSILKRLRSPSGLFLAAPSVATGYGQAAWIRDNLYISYGIELINPNYAVDIIHRLFDAFLKHEYKIDWAIKEKPQATYQYIHARYHPETLDEFWNEWGNKQNDAIGLFLFRVAQLYTSFPNTIRNDNDLRMLSKLVAYLSSIEYWCDKDHGIWEQHDEIHASSVGACVAGLKAIAQYIPVHKDLIAKGEETLKWLLPKESPTKEADLALLTLIYPYNLVSEEMRDEILRRVEKLLMRERGAIRYKGDWYYNEGGEAEWTMVFPWLAIIYKEMGNMKKYREYMKKTLECMNENGEIPELYYANSDKHNENTPLSWAQALYIVAAL